MTLDSFISYKMSSLLTISFSCHFRATLIRQLKEAQHNLMNVIMCIADQAIPGSRASRDFRVKYPDDVLLDQINGKGIKLT